eukprot:TRINITY_DN1305_c0_g1_i2.p2 TRINITY_DN1305_c0_g1~~TRINITY_DN1305_c0_g1_i2.p2  ORF type:complete len:133 (+),score=14.80 TRINITY_DN1305_c0_g1_i2:566-964(+)
MADTIKTVGTTMEFFLRSLPVRSKFNIIGFGTSFEKLFPCSVMYGDHTLAQALSHVTTMNANLGSTNLNGPLQSIFDEPYDDDFPRQIFVLTDGAVDDRTKTLSITAKNCKRTRAQNQFSLLGLEVELTKSL